MKKSMYKWGILVVSLLFMISCEEKFSGREYYNYQIYLTSENSYKVHTEEYPFNDGKPVVGYFSVGCGGSVANPEEVTVILEPDTTLFGIYNRFNFDIDTSKYALMLPKKRYKIESDTVIFPAKSKDQYVKVAVTVNPDGLSPDSTYFIPIRIKSVSRYKVNPDRSSILFRVVLKNNFAAQRNDTYYQMRGSQLNDNGEVSGTISATKLARPLSMNRIRMYAGGNTQGADAKVADIQRLSIVLDITDYKSISIHPYGTIEVEQLDGGEMWNRYEEVSVDGSSTYAKKAKYIYLYYRYRTLKTPATETGPAVYDNWRIVKEVLRRLE